MDPSAIPCPSHSSGTQGLTLTPENTYIHCGPSRTNTPPHINNSNYSHSPLTPYTPHTPASTAPNTCTVDEPLYTRVAVHTAKCTECDKRNMDTMRRCPGCTFQVCQPCYEKRQRQGKGLVHGNMPSPEETGAATPGGTGARASRKKPVGSAAKAKSSEKEVDEDDSEECANGAIKGGKHTPSVPKSKAGKRSRGRSCVKDSEAEDSSEGELDHASHTPSKRHQTLSFAESALATATRAPPTTRAAALRSNPSIASRAPPTLQSETVAHRVPVTHSREDFPYDDILYQNCVVDYDEPLLARCEPVAHNPAARIPAIIQRGGRRRPTADEICQNIQRKVREKLERMQAEKSVAGAEASSVPASYQAPDYKTAVTVLQFVEREAKRHQDANNLSEDDAKALFRIMQVEAISWGKKTFKKQEYGMRRLLLPGLNLRLDRIPSKYTVELRVLMDGVAEHALHELDEAATLSATSPPPPSG
ncbi:hypothetical protein COCMIDRAFT_103246 [Bipolaris oryzae ATCC 44560]|uniref:Uncharacterized protein n=1 Tax=Bipolaris oryzae ATCC 44560 TaxID=930090 RepID=W6YY93_COCMI|nr:uncharacterized protein COCMIDRAFT_103246 [Bipolaris oryzae ATCC 44560]EUC42540.1 hypothetical protein COCMIDRAFT_103246 [Bipolaris oryzae ATCC 44560]